MLTNSFMTSSLRLNSRALNTGKERPYSLRIRYNLVGPKLALPKYPVNECNRNFTYTIPKCSRSNHHLHLEYITLRLGHCYNVPKYGQPIKSAFIMLFTARSLVWKSCAPEAACKVTNTGIQHCISQEVGTPRHQLSSQIPAVNTPRGRVGGIWR